MVFASRRSAAANGLQHALALLAAPLLLGGELRELLLDGRSALGVSQPAGKLWTCSSASLSFSAARPSPV